MRAPSKILTGCKASNSDVTQKQWRMPFVQ